MTLEVSEDELGVFVACLDYVLDHFDDEALDQICGAYRDEIEGIRDDLTRLLDVSEPESPSIANCVGQLHTQM